MGGSQSTQNANLAEQRRQAERARLAEQERKRQEEVKRQREVEEQEEKEKAEELRIKKLILERKKLEAEAAQRARDHTHDEEMKKIDNLEKCEERRETYRDKAVQLEHERLMDINEKTFALSKCILDKVGQISMTEAGYGMAIAQAVQSGKTVDKETFAAVAAKIPVAPPPCLKQIVEEVIDSMDDREEDSRHNQIVVGHRDEDEM